MSEIRNLRKNLKSSKMRRTLLILVFAFIGVVSAKAQIVDSGNCGEDLTWVLSGEENDLTLTINGSGAMEDYFWDEVSISVNTPWWDYRSDIKILTLPNGITTIGNYAFCDCNKLMGNLSIPNSVKTIGRAAFLNCSSKSITIPNSVQNIGLAAFQYCNGLETLSIGNSVTIIDAFAFSHLSDLTDVIVDWEIPLGISSSVFTHVTLENIKLHVPKGTAILYSATAVWQDFQIEEYELQNIKSFSTTAINVYPNPTNDQLTITNCQLGAGNYEIYNLMWQLQKQGKLQGETTNVNIESLANGMYYLKVAGTVVKFVKE